MKKEIRDLLKMRADALAMEPKQKESVLETIEVVIFSLAAETYCIESSYIKEVYPLKEFTPLPGVPPFIMGIINVRGKIIAVIDLKKLFNLPEQGLGELNKIIILSDDQMEFGILADAVQGTQAININQIKNVPSVVSGIGEEYLKGITKEHLIVLNAAKLLSDQSIVIYDEII